MDMDAMSADELPDADTVERAFAAPDARVVRQQMELDTVAATLQTVYEDATQTPLDRKAATEVLRTLRGLGWVDLSFLALLLAEQPETKPGVHELRISRRAQQAGVSQDWQVQTYTDPASLDLVIQLRTERPTPLPDSKGI